MLSIALKALVLLAGLAGQLVSIARHSFMSGNHFLYYTNLSNLLIMLLMLVLLFFEIRNLSGRRPVHLPSWLLKARFILTAGILLTFAGFNLLLMPRLPAEYLRSPSNLLVHNAVPLLACCDFIFFPGRNEQKPRLWYALLLPLAYLVLLVVLGLLGHRFHGSVSPYFFLDYEQMNLLSIGQGKLGVLWWLLILASLQLVLGRLLLGLQGLAAREIGEQ